ncbi:glycosyltransferase [Flavobacterium sp. Sd200]|uniref:CgeB family protein n=1 Tax=Flavobacterium sp. Sd200 TaxID=2692211 RepID=UPI001371E295|nr:glycosyltransferase [Flavobacterium sp. Sd200]MXN91972.1 glycosyltransferase [Flavobacterium sp. Sd200]
MNILYIGDDGKSSTSYHRATALQRLGHTVHIINPKNAVSKQLKHPILSKVHFHTGYALFQNTMFKWLKKELAGEFKPDLIWVNAGELIGSKCVQELKKEGVPVILYHNDDPTGGRDGNRFKTLLNAIPYYDLCAVVRNQNVEEFKALGAKNVIRVNMSYDEVAHKPFDSAAEIPEKFRSDVAFIGTWMRNENRDEFILKLIEAGIPVNIWGDRWPKSPLWDKLKGSYKGGSLGGRDYVAAIQGAKICLGMLSKGNRDLHTTRSLEIPYIGGLLCAERTTEHTAMYNEGTEALFWDNADECIAECKKILNKPELIDEIKLNGRKRILLNKAGNEDVCNAIINELRNNNMLKAN